MCKMEAVVIPRPPAMPNGPLVSNLGQIQRPKNKNNSVSRNASIKSKLSNSSQGFRLVENAANINDETGSIYSIYKQKIDSMFESDSSSGKNSVQAKIEKMFSEVAKDHNIPMNDIGVHSFSVDYLGSVPLHEKVSSLSGLQNPLKDLYFSYKKTVKPNKAMTGRLEISSHGLRVLYQGDKGDLEQLNSFPTIAVWSAVKFVVGDHPNFSYAFLPLITDPDNMDKQALFRSLEDSEKKYISCQSHHSPLFAVVMRKVGVHKQLECHGFVCQTSEDAIVIAATLYKSLVAHMKVKERRLKNKNGITTCMSISSSINNDTKNTSIPVRPPRKKKSSTSSIISESEIISVSDTKPLLSSANKPPRKSSKTKRAPRAPSNKKEDLDAITPYEEPIQALNGSNNKINDANNNHNSQIPDNNEIREIKPKSFSDKMSTCMSKEQKLLTAEIKQMVSEGGSKYLKKVQNLRKPEENTLKKENTGDILTKVTIPRSGSFLNAGGLTRYKNKVSRNNEQASGGSPLGFKEIFNELSLQEGLHSLDDILGVIIDPEGMSFNDLKPIYKEFLLKLSLTLTKDELFQRSRMIMRKQKKKLMNRNNNSNVQRKPHVRVGGKFRRLKRLFQRNLKLKLEKKFGTASKQQRNQQRISPRINSKITDSSISTSSYDMRPFRPRKEINPNKKQPYKKRSSDSSKKYRRDRISTSEESDFFSLKRSKNQTFIMQTQNRNSSSGYVSCSECSYDSDTCTCVSADKCYCSLGHKQFSKPQKLASNHRCEHTVCCCQDVSFCECDTDSCTESNKCYCQNFATTEEILAGKTFDNNNGHKKLCKRSSNTKSTKSLEYIMNPSESYYEKLKCKTKYGSRNSLPILDDKLMVDYERLSLASMKGSQSKASPGKDFITEVGNDMDYSRPVTVKSYGTRSQASAGKTVQSSPLHPNSCSEALSVKKSAEIAALFADIKLSQTTNITHLAPDIVSSKNYYNKFYSNQKYAKPTADQVKSKQKVGNNWHHHQKNPSALYRNVNTKKPLSESRAGGKSGNMYSAKNGLYTIQSQSDDSRRSSINEGRRVNGNRDYFDTEPQIDYEGNVKDCTRNMEDSLGYLP